MLGLESTRLKIIAEHSFKRKTQHRSKFHLRLQLKIMLGLTKCEWQVWFKDCSLNFSSFYTVLMAQEGSDLCITLYTITPPQTSEQSTIANILRGTVLGHVKVSPKIPRILLFSINDTSLFSCICKKKPRALEWNPWGMFRKL